MPIFEITQGPGAGSVFHVEQDDFVLGRDPSSAVPLQDAAAGAAHVRIRRSPDGFVLADLGCPAGTFLNGHRVKELPLESGDAIRIGSTVLRFLDNAAPTPPDTIPLGPADEAPLAVEPMEGEGEAILVEPADGGTGVGGTGVGGTGVPPVFHGQDARAAAAAPPVQAEAAPAEAELVGPAIGAPGAPAAGRVIVGKPLTQIPLGKHLVQKMVCPNCWHSFPPESVLFVAQHPDLIGDPIAGPNEFRRFEPLRFSVDWKALDEREVPTTLIACPKCHLSLPEAAIDVFSLFISIVGSPASGKSYYLTAMVAKLRQTAPERFRLQFTDADVAMNNVIHESEKTLFHNPQPDKLTQLIKTQRDDPRLHRTVTIGGRDIRYPVPFQFVLRPTPSHPHHAESHRLGRLIVFYDNAGEDFQPNIMDPDPAAVQHLARSGIIFLLFDPIQEPAFREKCTSRDPQLTHGLRPAGTLPVAQVRQEQIVNEVGVRVRRFLRLPASQRIKKPLVVVVPKFDIWADLAGVSIDTEPFLDPGDGSPARVDIARVEHTSETLRKLFARYCPDFVATAENVSQSVCYIPVSSLGHPSVLTRRGGDTFYGVKPRDVAPKWVTVPFFYCMAKWGPRGLLLAPPRG